MTKPNHVNRLFLLILILIILFAIISPLIVISPSRHYTDSDFFSFWLASKMTWIGQNPYDTNLWIEGHSIHGAKWISDNTFLYPPGLSVLLAPIGLLSLFNAFVLWVFLSLSFLLFSLYILLTHWLSKSSLIPYFIPMLSGALLFRPFLATLIHGQIGALLMFIFILATYLMEKDDWLWSGVLLGISIIKPNVGLLIGVIVGFYALLTKKWQLLIGLVLGVIAIFIISQLRVPGWLSYYFQILSAKGNQTLGYSPTLWGMISLACDDKSICVMRLGSAVSSIVLLSIIILIIRKKGELSPYIVVSLAISTMVLITPYLWGYDQILLLVPIFVLSMEVKGMGYPYLVSVSIPLAFSLLATLLAYVGIYLLRDTASTLLSLVVFVAIIWLCFQNPQRLVSTEDCNPSY